MRRSFFAALLLLLAALPAHAAIVATCDPADPAVPGRLLSVAIRSVDAAELSDPSRIVWESPARPGARAITEWDERGQIYLALGRMPGSADKCSAGAIVPMTAQDLATIAAAELAARQAAAQASYGVIGCDLVEGDSIIGVCEDGTVVTSPRLAAALRDWLFRQIGAEHGEYLARWNDTIIGGPAMPSGRRVEVAGPVAVNGVESAMATLADVPLNTSVSRVLLFANVGLVKDSGTTARVVTVRIRRASDSAVIGQPCVVRSQAIASSDFGPCVITAVDVNPAAPGVVTYAVTATTPSGAASALRVSLVAVEVQ